MAKKDIQKSISRAVAKGVLFSNVQADAVKRFEIVVAAARKLGVDLEKEKAELRRP